MAALSGNPASSPAIYRGMDRAALDAAYNNAAAVADSQDWVQRWRERSAKVRAGAGARLDIAYGPRPRNRLDYFSSGAARAPVFVFIHGGYWQRNEKEAFAFVAEGPRAHGIDVVLVGYTLAPEVRLAEIVGEIRRSLDCLSAQAADLGFDANRIYVGGWSAGGHLTAAVADHPAFRGGMPISGIFDLEPIALNYLNEKVMLDDAEVASQSPQRNIPRTLPPLRISVGGHELPELVRQSRDYAAALQARGLPAQLTVLPGLNHFSIMEEIATPGGALTRDLVALIGATS
jgi:arylformamidase